MPHSHDSKAIRKATILSNGPISNSSVEDNYLLTLRVDSPFRPFYGQFIQIQVAGDPTSRHAVLSDADTHWDNLEPELNCRKPVLNRPFSVAGIQHHDQATDVHILYKVRGPGTVELSGFTAGSEITILGPLGQSGFKLPEGLDRAIVVGGGLGVAGTLFWLRHLVEQAMPVTMIAGSQNVDQLALPVSLRTADCNEELPYIFEPLTSDLVDLHLATDDGSAGFKGFASQALQAVLDEKPAGEKWAVFSCGPWPMLQALVSVCREHDLPCQVSLEEMMACGIGTCQACVIKVHGNSDKDEYKLCCKHGPVFDAAEIVWD